MGSKFLRNYPGVSERSKLNPLAKRTGGWRFFSMDSLSFLFLLGTKYLCFRPGARIQRPTSCITGSPLQPTEYLNMWRLWKTPPCSVLVVLTISFICLRISAGLCWRAESEAPAGAMSSLHGSGIMKGSASAMGTIMRMILQEPNGTSLSALV